MHVCAVMFRRALPLAVVLAVAFAAGSCGDAPTGLRARQGSVALAPRFAHLVAAGLVDVTAVRVQLTRPPSNAVVVDTVVVFPVGSDEVEVTLRAPLTDGDGSYDLWLAMVDAAGDTVFRAGPEPVTLSDSPEPAISAPELQYTGAGADAAGVRFLTPPEFVSFGQSVTLAAEAFDLQQQAIAGTPIGFALADSADTVRATIPDAVAGTLVAGSQRGTVTVRAYTPADLGATHVITVQPTPSALEIVSGDGQTAISGEALSAPLVARVLAADQLGVEGIEVLFAVDSGGGSITIETDTTDANGEAMTEFTLGVGTGVQSVTAVAPALAGASVTFSATATAGPPAELAFATQPTIEAADQVLPVVEVHLLDANGFLSTDATTPVTLTLSTDPSGVGPLTGTLTVAAVGGVATFDDLRIATAASGYVLNASAAGLPSADSDPFDVTAGAASSLAFVTQRAFT